MITSTGSFFLKLKSYKILVMVLFLLPGSLLSSMACLNSDEKAAISSWTSDRFLAAAFLMHSSTTTSEKGIEIREELSLLFNGDTHSLRQSCTSKSVAHCMEPDPNNSLLSSSLAFRSFPGSESLIGVKRFGDKRLSARRGVAASMVIIRFPTISKPYMPNNKCN
jgi:hypothetical protein